MLGYGSDGGDGFIAGECKDAGRRLRVLAFCHLERFVIPGSGN